MAGGRESWASSEAVRRSMVGNRSRDTSIELAVRRLLHARGLRYRVDHPLGFDRRRRADVVFPRARVAVFMDGCFWHGCPQHYREPRTNRDFWAAKISANRDRDADTTRRLEEGGWTPLRFWGHEDPRDVARAVESAVLAGGRQPRGE